MIPDAAIGAIGAAGIAAVISLTSLVIGKENKTSEFRQAWINDLRREIAETMAAVYILNQLLGEPRENRDNEAYRIAFERFSTARGLINLRLNTDEEDSAALVTTLRRMEDRLYQAFENCAEANDMTALHAMRDEAVAIARKLLKAEWSRVKAGEPTFLLTKRLSLAAGVICAVVIIGFLIRASI